VQKENKGELYKLTVKLNGIKSLMAKFLLEPELFLVMVHDDCGAWCMICANICYLFDSMKYVYVCRRQCVQLPDSLLILLVKPKRNFNRCKNCWLCIG